MNAKQRQLNRELFDGSDHYRGVLLVGWQTKLGAKTGEQTMNRLLTAAIAVSALAAAAPVMAQTHFDDRASQLDQRIDDAVHDGRLSGSDARLLRSELRSDQRLQDQYESDGMAGWQRRELERRFDRLSDNIIHMESGSFE